MTDSLLPGARYDGYPFNTSEGDIRCQGNARPKAMLSAQFQEKVEPLFAASLVFNLQAQLQTFPIYSKGLSGVSSDCTTVPASSSM